MNDNPLIGRTIAAIDLADDKGAIRFQLDGGDSIVARADGGCCSHTWIEALDTPLVLLGSPVTAVDDIAMPDLGTPPDHESLAYYGCKISTGKGFCVIDYRNSSNGHYGGNLVWPGEYFFGGVHGQNESKQNWLRIAP